MSVLYVSSNGCIICHLQFIHRLYHGLHETDNQTRLCKELFEIQTPYLKDCQAKNVFIKASSSGIRNVSATSLMNKRKRELPLLTEKQNDIDHVQHSFLNLIEEGRKCGYFQYNHTETDVLINNEEARTRAKSFYEHSSEQLAHQFHGGNTTNETVVQAIEDKNYVFPPNCAFFCYDVRDIEKKLDVLAAPYDLILLDPPWWNKYIRRKKAKCKEASYQMMYDEDLAKIPVSELSAPGTLVAVWCTNSDTHLTAIKELMFPAWGLDYIGKWFWMKVTIAGEPVCQFSVPPGKQPFEQIVFGCKAPETRQYPLPEDKKLIVSVPSAIHSHKPPLSDVLSAYLPPEPKCIELFARYLLPGWTSWGNEVLRLQEESLYCPSS